VALKESEELGTQARQLTQRNNALRFSSPISGTILSSRLQDRVGGYLPEGQELLEIADLSSLRARIYISEFELNKIRSGARAKLQVQGLTRMWDAETLSIAARPTEMDPRLQAQTALKGMNPPHYYLVDLVVKNPDGFLRPGMSGVARVYGKRRSPAGLLWESISDFFGRKFW
jgi:hypothetical protein